MGWSRSGPLTAAIAWRAVILGVTFRVFEFPSPHAHMPNALCPAGSEESSRLLTIVACDR